MRQRQRICPAHALCTAATIDSCAMAKNGSPVLASSASRITDVRTLSEAAGPSCSNRARKIQIPRERRDEFARCRRCA